MGVMDGCDREPGEKAVGSEGVIVQDTKEENEHIRGEDGDDVRRKQEGRIRISG